NPMFDAESKYLFFVSLRDFNPSTGALELNFNISDGQRIYGYTLNRNTASPFAPKNEDVGEEKPADNNPQQNAGGMDLNAIDTRLFVLPLPPSNYTLHASAPGKLFYSSG